MKTCTKCKKEFPATPEYFHRHKSNKDGFQYLCKKCQDEQSKEYQKSPKGKIGCANRQLKYTYGITIEDKLWLFVKQKGRCAICNKEFIISRAFIDHNHETGKIRGLLCCKCNVALAAIENAEYHKEAIKYLKKNGVVR